MKMVWVAIGIIVVISISAIGIYGYSVQLHDQLVGSLSELDKAAVSENWREVQRISEGLEKTWNKADATWSPVMDRRDLDRVDESLARVGYLSENCRKDELLLEISIAKRFVTQLLQKESLSIKSVF